MKYDGRNVTRQERVDIDEKLRTHPLTAEWMKYATPIIGVDYTLHGRVYVFDPLSGDQGLIAKAIYSQQRPSQETRILRQLAHIGVHEIVPVIREQIFIPDDEIYVDEFIVMTKLSGADFQSKTYPRSSLFELGRSLAELHQGFLRADQTGDTLGIDPRNQQNYHTQSLKMCVDMVGALLPLELKSKLSQVFFQYNALNTHLTPIHGDIHGGNVIGLRNGRIGFCDFETVQYAHPGFDLINFEWSDKLVIVDGYNLNHSCALERRALAIVDILSVAFELIRFDTRDYAEKLEKLRKRLEDPRDYYGGYSPYGLDA